MLINVVNGHWTQLLLKQPSRSTQPAFYPLWDGKISISFRADMVMPIVDSILSLLVTPIILLANMTDQMYKLTDTFVLILLIFVVFFYLSLIQH